MLKNRTWLTEDNEVYSDIGWIHISKAINAKFLVGLDKHEKFVKTSITELNIIEDFKGPVLFKRNGGFYLNAKNMLFYKDCLWRPGQELPLPKLINKKDFSGKLYNIVTGVNTLISRSYTNKYLHNDDYLVSICLAK